VLAAHDRRRGRHVQDEQPALAVPAHEARAEPEVIVEPAAECRRQRGDGGHGAVDARKGSELAVLRARVRTVHAGEVDGERKPDDRHEHHDEQGLQAVMPAGSGHQNRK
jgi:hypothetical protein